jgi:hypothetical protein
MELFMLVSQATETRRAKPNYFFYFVCVLTVIDASAGHPSFWHHLAQVVFHGFAANLAGITDQRLVALVDLLLVSWLNGLGAFFSIVPRHGAQDLEYAKPVVQGR